MSPNESGRIKQKVKKSTTFFPFFLRKVVVLMIVVLTQFSEFQSIKFLYHPGDMSAKSVVLKILFVNEKFYLCFNRISVSHYIPVFLGFKPFCICKPSIVRFELFTESRAAKNAFTFGIFFFGLLSYSQQKFVFFVNIYKKYSIKIRGGYFT